MDAVPLAVAICVCEQGGPDSSAVKNMPYYNQWEDLDDSPIAWHITEVGASVMNLRGSQCTWHPYRKAPCHVRRDRRILSCCPAKRDGLTVYCAGRGAAHWWPRCFGQRGEHALCVVRHASARFCDIVSAARGCAACHALRNRWMACGRRRRHLLSCEAVVSCVAKWVCMQALASKLHIWGVYQLINLSG